jgi:hypothetical protein
MLLFGNRGRWSLRNQAAAAEPVIEREIARMPADAVERIGSSWPVRRAIYGWWDRRRGPRAASWAIRTSIHDRMAAIAPDIYIYFNSPWNYPQDERYDERWEIVACALEDAVYAEVNVEQITPSDYARLRAHWEVLCA